MLHHCTFSAGLETKCSGGRIAAPHTIDDVVDGNILFNILLYGQLLQQRSRRLPGIFFSSLFGSFFSPSPIVRNKWKYMIVPRFLFSMHQLLNTKIKYNKNLASKQSPKVKSATLSSFHVENARENVSSPIIWYVL